mmetsp:Transcript_106612/g.296667  ORF Transcript_106612/g.296667 Transcript_106612/m.296667 type:complete len:241 (-) Transcript_106612:538-1260(-)
MKAAIRSSAGATRPGAACPGVFLALGGTNAGPMSAKAANASCNFVRGSGCAGGMGAVRGSCATGATAGSAGASSAGAGSVGADSAGAGSVVVGDKTAAGTGASAAAGIGSSPATGSDASSMAGTSAVAGVGAAGTLAAGSLDETLAGASGTSFANPGTGGASAAAAFVGGSLSRPLDLTGSAWLVFPLEGDSAGCVPLAVAVASFLAAFGSAVVGSLTACDMSSFSLIFCNAAKAFCTAS